MKKTVEKEITLCDFCGQETYPHPCFACGRDVCWECITSGGGIEYPHGVFCGGAGDGVYCRECDQKLQASRSDSLYFAYQAIQELREESKRFYESYRLRADLAEAEVQRLYRARFPRN